jgi:hypothetical protein
VKKRERERERRREKGEEIQGMGRERREEWRGGRWMRLGGALINTRAGTKGAVKASAPV